MIAAKIVKLFTERKDDRAPEKRIQLKTKTNHESDETLELLVQEKSQHKIATQTGDIDDVRRLHNFKNRLTQSYKKDQECNLQEGMKVNFWREMNKPSKDKKIFVQQE